MTGVVIIKQGADNRQDDVKCNGADNILGADNDDSHGAGISQDVDNIQGARC